MLLKRVFSLFVLFLFLSLSFNILSLDKSISASNGNSSQIIERGEYYNIYENDDGTYTMESSTCRINYHNETGWHPIDNTIIELDEPFNAPWTVDDFEYRNKHNSLDVYFQSETFYTQDQYALNYSGYWFRNEYKSLKIANEDLSSIYTIDRVRSGGRPINIDGATATYENVHDDGCPNYDYWGNLQYAISNGQVKQSLSLPECPEHWSSIADDWLLMENEWHYDSSLSVWYGPDSSDLTEWDGQTNIQTRYIEYHDSSDETIYIHPRILTKDYTGENMSEGYYYMDAENNRLFTMFDYTWLEDVAVYPLNIDPSSTIYGNTGDGWVDNRDATWSGCQGASTGDSVDANNQRDAIAIAASAEIGGFLVYRAFYSFDTSGLPNGAAIDDARVDIHGYSNGGITVTIQESTWNSLFSPLSTSHFDAFTGLYFDTVTNWQTGADNWFDLNQAGKDSINKTGNTEFCLREYNYDYSNRQPSRRNLAGVYWAEALGEAQAPRLLINYTTNNPPVIEEPSPVNQTENLNLRPTCSIVASDNDDDTMTVKFYNTTDDRTKGLKPWGLKPWTLQQTNNSVSSRETVYWNYSQADMYGMKYYWKVTVDDGTDTTSEHYWFITKSDPDWVNPDTAEGTDWTNPNKAKNGMIYKDNHSSTATQDSPIYLNMSTPLSNCDRVRVFVAQEATTMPVSFNDADIVVSVKYNNKWVETYDGTISKFTWTNLSLEEGNQTVSGVKITSNSGGIGSQCNLYAVQLYQWPTEIIWLDVTNESWSLGTVTMSTSYWTNQTGETFICDKDNCTVYTDLSMQITNDASTWSAATSGNGPGADTYRLNASVDTWSTENQIVTASDTVISSNIPPTDNETFDLRFDSPTSSTSGEQQTITVTAVLSKH